MFKTAIFLSGLLSFTLFAADQYPSSQAAAFYNNHSQQQWNVAYTALKDFTLRGNENILDLGCGTGKVTANIAGRVLQGSILGLDLSHGMIVFAQNNFCPFYKNLTFLEGDVLKLNFVSEYDVISSFSSLHWIVDHSPLLNSVHKALKPGGAILFTIPCTPLPEVAQVFKDVTDSAHWQSYLKNYHHPRKKFTADEYRFLLAHAGFVEIEVKQVPFTYFFETKKDFVDWFAAFSPMLCYIPLKEHESFMQDIVERYLQSFPMEKDGQIAFKQNELIIQARK